MILQICPGTKSYDIVIERGCLKKAGALLPLQRKVLIVTDSGVPERYASSLAAACEEPVICTIGQGESNKTLRNFQRLLSTMLAKGFDRNDCVVAVGGGCCGFMTGWACHPPVAWIWTRSAIPCGMTRNPEAAESRS